MFGFKFLIVYLLGEGDIIYYKYGSKLNKDGNGFGLVGLWLLKVFFCKCVYR